MNHILEYDALILDRILNKHYQNRREIRHRFDHIVLGTLVSIPQSNVYLLRYHLSVRLMCCPKIHQILILSCYFQKFTTLPILLSCSILQFHLSNQSEDFQALLKVYPYRPID